MNRVFWYLALYFMFFNKDDQKSNIKCTKRENVSNLVSKIKQISAILRKNNHNVFTRLPAHN